MPKKFFTCLDRRHTGYPQWQYYIERPLRYNYFSMSITRYESLQLFNQWRVWCWETWGASKELHEWIEDIKHSAITPVAHNESWCWVHEVNGNSRIYLRGEPELTLFTLKWA